MQLDHDDVCVNFTVERWFPVANMSRYLPIRVYDYYAPGMGCLLNWRRIDKLILEFPRSPERFNETIFDALPTYLLNICEVCGSSQCPYCTIYNMAVRHSTSVMLLLSAVIVVVIRNLRVSRSIQNSFLWNQ